MILVTGATGFVGRALVRDLTSRRIDFRAASRTARAGHFAIGTITPGTDWTPALDGIDTVIHLAARVHVMRERQEDPLAAFRAMNVEATLSLARQAAAAGATRFVFVSSIKVNGETTPDGAPFGPEDPPCPQDAYGVSKAEAEAALMRMGKETGLEIVIVRPPLIYGPGVGANFRLLMRWAGSGLPSPFGACANQRSLLYVENLSDLLILTATHPAAAHQIFLASDGKDLSTASLFRSLARLQDRKGRSLPVPVRFLETMAGLSGMSSFSERLLRNLQVDIRKTETLLGWTPKFSTEQGLQQTLRNSLGPD